MENYRKMYSTLFNAITDALAQIENQNYGDAKSTLIAAQQKAEEMYITAQNRNRSSPERRAKQCRAVRSAGRIIQKGGARPLTFGR